MPDIHLKNMPANTTDDPTAASRKEDHIELAFRSQVDAMALDQRFYYEPLLAAHPAVGSLPEVAFGDKRMKAPLWVSSMTGGTEKAYIINQNLAQACNEFGLGMGLGSCRPLLSGTERLKDFDIRSLTGDEVPLYANLGIAQIQELFTAGREQEIFQMCDLLRVDGLIIHVNPLQEAMQPEGDVFTEAPITTIKATLAALPGLPIIVKEVGQGIGPQSLAQLLRLPLLAIDTAANGGTNFSKLELLRSDETRKEAFAPIVNVGHGADEMVGWVNDLLVKERAQAMEQTRKDMDVAHTRVQCKHLIISGGLRTFLDGYYLTEKSKLPAVYGQASAFLKYARNDYATLQGYVSTQIRGLELAKAYLRPRV